MNGPRPLGCAGTYPAPRLFPRSLQPLPSPPTPHCFASGETCPLQAQSAGPLREATRGGQQGARPARPALYRLRCWGAGRQRPPRRGRLWEAGSGRPEPPSARGQVEIRTPGSVRVGQPAPRTRSHGRLPQARPLGDAPALGSTLQTRKLRPPSYKWQIGLGLEPGLPVPSLHRA